MFVFMYVCMYFCLCVIMCVEVIGHLVQVSFPYVCMYVCMCVCVMYVCICMCLSWHVYRGHRTPCQFSPHSKRIESIGVRFEALTVGTFPGPAVSVIKWLNESALNRLILLQIYFAK